jgi:hypothetical protein
MTTILKTRLAVPSPFPSLHRFPFRPDVGDNPVEGFDRDLQIALCTDQLESLRERHAQLWVQLATPKPTRASGLRELKDIVKHHIRHASESTDFYATVDFITQSVHRLLSQRCGSRKMGLLQHLYDWDIVSHEHMVPGEFVFREFTSANSRFQGKPLLEPMAKWSLRALVAGTKRKRKEGTAAPSEVQALGGPLESDMPCPAAVYGMPGLTLERIPLEFYGLVRYEAAGLADELIPVSARARDLWPAYVDFRARL